MTAKKIYNKPLFLNVSYSPTELKQKSAEIFNKVQENRVVIIASATRPEMVLMKMEKLELERKEYEYKIEQLVDVIKKLEEK